MARRASWRGARRWAGRGCSARAISMNALERALREFLAARPSQAGLALVGGLAVSVRTEPRFTRDLDFAVALNSDAEAEQYVLLLRQAGYQLAAALEQV